MTDDAELLRRYVADGSQEAFAEFVRRHLKLVYFAALRRTGGDTHRAEDVTQTVFAAAACSAKSLQRHRVLTGWLYVTMRNAAANAMRAEQRRRRREEESHIMQESLSDPTTEIDWRRLKPALEAAVEKLNERDRNAVLLRFSENNSLAEIGSHLDISENAARMRIDRALEKLRVLLARRGITSTAAALAATFVEEAGATIPAGLESSVLSSALAPIGSAASVSAGIVPFMTSTKIAGLAALATFATLLTLGLAFHQYHAAQLASARLAVARRDYAALIVRQRQRIEQSPEALARLEGSPSLAAGGGASSFARKSAFSANHARPSTNGSNKPSGPTANRELSNNPAIRRAFSEWFDETTDLRFAPLFATLGLSPDKIAALENLMAQRDIFASGAVLTLRPDGVSPAEVTQEVKALLGDDAYHQFIDYGATSLVRLVTDGLAGNLYDSDSPLTTNQADQLTQILANSSHATPGLPPRPSDVDWDAALAQARAILSPSQFTVFSDEAQLIAAAPPPFGGLNSVYPAALAAGSPLHLILPRPSAGTP